MNVIYDLLVIYGALSLIATINVAYIVWKENRGDHDE